MGPDKDFISGIHAVAVVDLAIGAALGPNLAIEPAIAVHSELHLEQSQQLLRI